MISKRTMYLFLAALLLTLPVVWEAIKKEPLCVQDTRLERRPSAPSVVRSLHAGADRPRLVRVQDEELPDEDPPSPCPSTLYQAIIKVLGFVAACVWACSLASLAADVRTYMRRKRRREKRLQEHLRRERVRMERVKEGRHDQAG